AGRRCAPARRSGGSARRCRARPCASTASWRRDECESPARKHGGDALARSPQAKVDARAVDAAIGPGVLAGAQGRIEAGLVEAPHAQAGLGLEAREELVEQ